MDCDLGAVLILPVVWVDNCSDGLQGFGCGRRGGWWGGGKRRLRGGGGGRGEGEKGVRALINLLLGYRTTEGGDGEGEGRQSE